MKRQEYKELIVKALVDSCGIAEEEAEEAILEADELDGGIGEELMEEMCGVDETEFGITYLYYNEHPYNMSLSCEGDDYCYVFISFDEVPNVAAVEAAFDEYESGPLADELSIENDIDSERDLLCLGYQINGDLYEGLMELFETLDREEFSRLVEAVLTKED